MDYADTNDGQKRYYVKYDKAKFVNFLPYIGPEYAQSEPKIFILGHSHYAKDKSPTEVAEWDKARDTTYVGITDDYLATLECAKSEGKNHPHSWVKCYRNMAATLTGEGYHESDYIWDRLAFSEFWQKVVGSSPRGREFYTPELHTQSRNAFFENLEFLQPDLVIVWGSKLYEELPEPGWKELPRENDSDPWIGFYENYPKTMIWTMTRHPSRGFSYNNEHRIWKAVQSKTKLYMK